ncbi:MAG TPA: SURF1 family protein [Anaerolineales bacterium]|nr:SURF1 family protein [Anaerolineales bacterium]
MLLRKIFSRKWWFTTLLVLFGAAVCIRLGIWQLDRLEGRRAFNAQVQTMRARAPVDLTTAELGGLETMEWRAVTVTGEYDFANQVVLRNQYNKDQYGYHLLTPLLFNTSTGSVQAPTAVLVDRGWIPADGNSAPGDWRKYDEAGVVTVTGQIRLGQSKPAFGGVPDAPPADGSPLWVWNNADIENIALQLPYPILNVYIQPNVEPDDDVPPIPYQPVIELTEGPHFGYALQWFTFAAILLFGYPFYLRKQE